MEEPVARVTISSLNDLLKKAFPAGSVQRAIERGSALGEMLHPGERWGMIYWCGPCQIDWWLNDGETIPHCMFCSGPVEEFTEAMATVKLAGAEAALNLADARREELGPDRLVKARSMAVQENGKKVSLRRRSVPAEIKFEVTLRGPVRTK